MIFRCDFHIHSCLSPCADISMTPNDIALALKKAQIEWISITDHNSCGNVAVFEKVLKRYGISLLAGIEVQTKEEVHVLVYLRDVETAQKFSDEVGTYLPKITNDPERFGYQLFVDENDKFIGMENKMLSAATSLSLYELWSLVKKYGGLFVYAHANRKFGVMNQLGFIPKTPKYDAVEIVGKVDFYDFYQGEAPVLKSSDAHFLSQIKIAQVAVNAYKKNFDGFKKALMKKEVRLL